jgi:hypothetical protein
VSRDTEPRPRRPRPVARVADHLRQHPILVLLLLTPGIPEYRSGSSDLTGLLWNPAVFGVFLLLNIAMYTPGALLIREAMVRWNSGWGAVAVLGVGDAVMEEGIADATFFNPHNPNVGVLGSFGHFLGTNWLWVPGVVMVHVVFSLAIPIFLFGTAFPSLRGRPMLTPRQIGLLLGILTLDTVAIAAVGAGALHWVDGPVAIGACLAVIALCVLVAGRLPAGWPRRASELPRLTPAQFFGVGLALFPTVAAVTPLLGILGAPAAPVFLALLGVLSAFAVLLYATVGQAGHRRHMLAFSAGAIVPLAVLGFLGGFPVPLVVAADALAFVFFRRMWHRCVDEDALDTGAAAAVPAAAAAQAG